MGSMGELDLNFLASFLAWLIIANFLFIIFASGLGWLFYSGGNPTQ
jgi:hypothetical protein